MKLLKNTQSGRSLLSKSFLSRMVQMRSCFLTRCTNKVHEDKNTKQMSRYAQETGRSMVEMLGVLAIIGVLSVGGIAGYSKAMFKHKINKTIDQVTTISHNIRTLCFDRDDKCPETLCISGPTGASSGCQLHKSLKLIPDDMWNEETNSFSSVFGSSMEVDFSSTYAFIMFNELPINICTALASVDWESMELGVTSISISPEYTAYTKEAAANYNITLTRENSLPMPIDIISEACQQENNYVLIVFDNI